MPVPFYVLESCQLSNANLRSLNFTFNRLFMKLFKTKSIDVMFDRLGGPRKQIVHIKL